MLEFKQGVLTQKGQKTWEHINYRNVTTDLLAIQRKYRMTKIVVDRTGVGDAVIEMLTNEIPFEEIVMSLPTINEIINMIHSLFHGNKLIIKDKILYEQVLEQEQHISDAGNILYRHPTKKHDDLFWALGYACYACKGYFAGTPDYVMSRSDRNFGESDVNKDILETFGEGWNVQSR